MASPSPGFAYCIVKSCPVGTCSYERMVNDAVGSMDFGRPNTIVVLPHQRQLSTLAPIAIVEELRSILTDEATSLDPATKSVWRLEIDPLTVLNTISKLGFRASHFDVNSVDGVHTWTMSCELPETTKIACNPDAQNKVEHRTKPKAGSRKRQLECLSISTAQNGMQQSPVESFNTGGDFDDENENSRLSAKSSQTKKHAGSNDNVYSPFALLNSKNRKYLMSAEPSHTILEDFLTEDVIPPQTRETYYSIQQSDGLQANRVRCCCANGNCVSGTTVAGRRYCQFAMDRAVNKILNDCGKNGFKISAVCRKLLNSVYSASELCCLTHEKLPIASYLPTTKSAVPFVPIPPEHFNDIQRVLIGYWNAFICRCLETLNDDFFRTRAPTPSIVRSYVLKLVSDTRIKLMRQLPALTPKSSNDDAESFVGVEKGEGDVDAVIVFDVDDVGDEGNESDAVLSKRANGQ